MDRSLSDKGAAFIGRFEGFRACTYRDVVGVLTIGFGTTDPRVARPGNCITREKGLRLLKRDANELIPVIQRAASFHLKQHELDALISLGYNVGPGVFSQGRSMGNALRSGSRLRVQAAFMLYVFAGGQRLLGLVRRRFAERRLFKRGLYA